MRPLFLINTRPIIKGFPMALDKSFNLTLNGATSAKVVPLDIRASEFNVGVTVQVSGTAVWNIDGSMVRNRPGLTDVWTQIASAGATSVVSVTTPYSKIRIRHISGNGEIKGQVLQSGC